MALIAYVVLGLVLAVLGVEFGLVAMAIAVILAVAVAVKLRTHGGALVLVALGATWTILFTSSAWTCALPDRPCGATPLDVTPHVFASLALVVVGVCLALWRPHQLGAR